ncbi:hypothetical protein [Nodularia sp. LEGE 06071]
MPKWQNTRNNFGNGIFFYAITLGLLVVTAAALRISPQVRIVRLESMNLQ